MPQDTGSIMEEILAAPGTESGVTAEGEESTEGLQEQAATEQATEKSSETQEEPAQQTGEDTFLAEAVDLSSHPENIRKLLEPILKGEKKKLYQKYSVQRQQELEKLRAAEEKAKQSEEKAQQSEEIQAQMGYIQELLAGMPETPPPTVHQEPAKGPAYKARAEALGVTPEVLAFIEEVAEVKAQEKVGPYIESASQTQAQVAQRAVEQALAESTSSDWLPFQEAKALMEQAWKTDQVAQSIVKALPPGKDYSSCMNRALALYSYVKAKHAPEYVERAAKIKKGQDAALLKQKAGAGAVSGGNPAPKLEPKTQPDPIRDVLFDEIIAASKPVLGR